MIAFAKAHKIVVVQDAAHMMLSYEGNPLSFLSVPGAMDVGVEVHSLSKGWDIARIGRDVFISQHSVRTHLQNILEKLGMHSKLEAATFAMQRSMELELTPGGAGGDR